MTVKLTDEGYPASAVECVSAQLKRKAVPSVWCVECGWASFPDFGFQPPPPVICPACGSKVHTKEM